ncbi:SDR family oxidoreductase [Naasia sp. SYSU D00948]|uniref:SDR family oxidoreductase n=1 Tax=Naasia sp. SYSU D00948 TaxID=2817379 RepID=UPI001B308530|nr:SDR family oxidoreductase [Naasia sp. SYSU D00948]
MPRERKVAVITGASSGIGRAAALRFADKGWAVVLGSRREDALTELAEECRARGGDGIAVPTDMSNAGAVQALADAAVQRYGRIDVWVNNAAVGIYGPFLDIPLDDFRRLIDVNVMGYVYGARAALEVMTGQGRGVLINVSSIVAEVPGPYTAPYAMSKAAVRSLSTSLRQELWLQGQKKIKVATVLPATIDTPFFRHAANYSGRKVVAMPPVYSADKVALAIRDLAKAPRDEVVVGGVGKAMVKQHRVTPGTVEAQMAVQVDKTHLSRKESAADTAGTLYQPVTDPSDPEVGGGWHGKTRTARRGLLTWAGLLGGGLLASRLLRSGTPLSLVGSAALAKGLKLAPAPVRLVGGAALAKRLKRAPAPVRVVGRAALAKRLLSARAR